VQREAVGQVVRNDACRGKIDAVLDVLCRTRKGVAFNFKHQLRRLIRKVRGLFRRKRRLRPFSEVWDEFNRRADRCEEDIDPDEVFRDVRSKDPGRDFNF